MVNRKVYAYCPGARKASADRYSSSSPNWALNGAGPHCHWVLTRGSDPTGPNPSWARTAGFGPTASVMPASKMRPDTAPDTHGGGPPVVNGGGERQLQGAAPRRGWGGGGK